MLSREMAAVAIPEAFLQAIRANCLADEPRLVLADWLEDQGQVLFAELIRLQLELTHLVHDAAARWSLVQRESIARAALIHGWKSLQPRVQLRFRRGLPTLTLSAEQFLELPLDAIRTLQQRGVVELRLTHLGEADGSLDALLTSGRLRGWGRLDLDHHFATTRAATWRAFLADPALQGVSALNLANAGLTDRTVLELRRAPLSAGLHWLGLRNNRLTQRAFDALSQAETLTHCCLDLDGNAAVLPPAVSTENHAALWPRAIVNSLGMTLVRIPAGIFVMGAPPDEWASEEIERPQHEVTISRAFYLSATPITQLQYQTLMRANPSHFSGQGPRSGGPHHPADQVSWFNAVAFCEALSNLPAERQAGRHYRLPTEAEWEYACRADTTTPFSCGLTLQAHQANCDFTSPWPGCHVEPYLSRTTPVGAYPPNDWGLFDVHGNVYEWCQDYFDPDYYHDSSSIDPTGPETGWKRVIRGGSWLVYPYYCRSALRNGWDPELSDESAKNEMVGFRVAMTLAEAPTGP